MSSSPFNGVILLLQKSEILQAVSSIWINVSYSPAMFRVSLSISSPANLRITLVFLHSFGLLLSGVL
jgi:hypothetical protein